MANSITLNTDKHNERYLQAKCTQTKNSSAENSSKVEWELSAVGDSTWYSTGPTKLIIGGVTVYSSERIDWSAGKFPVAQGSTSGTVTIPHDTDGSKEITVELSTAIYYSTVKKYETKWTLDPIPRYPTVAHSLNSKTETSITMNWSSDSIIDYVWYSIDGGTNWVDVGAVNAKSGTYTINGLTPNSGYDIVTSLKRKDSQLWKNSTKTKIWTYDYPFCLTTADFMIGDKTRLTFFNPLKREFKFYVIANDVQIDREWVISGEAYEGLSADSTQALLYATIPNAKSAKYKIKTVWGDYTWTADYGSVMSIKESECLPTFTGFTYADTSYVANNTGDNQVLVKNHSTLSVTIPESQKMIVKNGAHPDKYVISIDTKSETVPYAEGAVVKGIGTISNRGVLRLTVRAFDSRGLHTEAHKDITVYDYEKPVINVDVKRKNNFEAQTTLKVNGSFYPVTLVNGLNANTIRNVYYRYREVGGSWCEIIEIAKTISDDKYTCSDVVIGLDNGKAFEFEILTYDAMDYNTADATVNVGQAVFFISSNQKACYINGQKIIMYDVVDTWEGW